MSIIKNTFIKPGLYLLRKRSGKIRRITDITGFNKVSSVILLFEIKESKIPLTIEKFTQTLIEEKKQVHQILYYSGNPKKLTITGNEHRMIITRKNLNLFRIPSAKVIEDFSKINANYIIDLNLNDCFPLIYLAGISTAPFRIGKQSPLRLPYFDLLINLQTENRQEFADHMLHYIKILKPPHYA